MDVENLEVQIWTSKRHWMNCHHSCSTLSCQCETERATVSWGFLATELSASCFQFPTFLAALYARRPLDPTLTREIAWILTYPRSLRSQRDSFTNKILTITVRLPVSEALHSECGDGYWLQSLSCNVLHCSNLKTCDQSLRWPRNFCSLDLVGEYTTSRNLCRDKWHIKWKLTRGYVCFS